MMPQSKPDGDFHIYAIMDVATGLNHGMEFSPCSAEELSEFEAKKLLHSAQAKTGSSPKQILVDSAQQHGRKTGRFEAGDQNHQRAFGAGRAKPRRFLGRSAEQGAPEGTLRRQAGSAPLSFDDMRLPERLALGNNACHWSVTMQLTAVITPAEEGGFVALNPETGTTSQGETIEEAIANLTEATSLYLEEFPLISKGHPLVTVFNIPGHA